MLAVRAAAPGDPAQLRATEVPRPASRPDELLVRVAAAGVNRSDVLACRGTLPGPFPRTLGRDFAGTVVAGPAGWIGRRVWGAGGHDIGLGRNGSHAQYLTIPEDAACEVPDRLQLPEAAASALAYFTASAAWDLAGGVEPGSTVVVTGAAGAVGAAAAALAAHRGARVIGVVRRSEGVPNAVDVVVRSDLEEVPAAIVRASGGAGPARAVDTVGGPLAAQLLAAMGVRGSVCILSTPPAQPAGTVDFLQFYRRELRLTGLHTGRLSATDAARALSACVAGLNSGALPPTRVHSCHPLTAAAGAYRTVEQGARGRVLLIPDHQPADQDPAPPAGHAPTPDPAGPDRVPPDPSSLRGRSCD